jgi:ATP-binding cassette subfamily B protein
MFRRLNPHRFPVVAMLLWLPRIGVGRVAALLGLVILTGLLTTNSVVVSGSVVGAIPAAVETGLQSDAGRRLYELLGINAGVLLLSTVASTAQNVLGQTLGSRFEFSMKRDVMRATLAPRGIAHLEDSSFLDELRLADAPEATYRVTLQSLARVATQRIGGVSSALVLFAFSWWAPLLLGAACLIQYRWLTREQDNLYQIFTEGSQGLRRSGYFWELATGGSAAKEIRVFGLQGFVIDRLRRHWVDAMSAIWKARNRLSGEMARAIALTLAIFGVFFFILARTAVNRQISLAELVVYAQAAIVMFASLALIEDAHLRLRKGARGVAHAITLDPKGAALSGSVRDVDGLPKTELRFEGVTFAYPGTDYRVFDGLDLVVRAGQSTAIVGDNGAGKTTLVKLLCRLYDPQAGSIAVDGLGLATFDPQKWRERVSVIFQDFVQYHLPAEDNVAFGAKHLRPEISDLDRAASLAGATSIIGSLPHGWDTVLSRQYRNGTDLSGGQWQRIALARALVSGPTGGVLILDEPTASLDVRAEAELFLRFLDITRGRTTILISHRFSTVRRADRICVLDAGRLIEEGTHEELLKRGGKYAHMFNLQASRFEEQAGV